MSVGTRVCAQTGLSLPTRIRSIAASRGHQVALIDEAGAATYGELATAIATAAAQWRSFGIEAGDRIATAMEPSSAYAALLLGCLAAGIVPAPVNTRLSPVEARRFLDAVGATVVVADTVHADLAEATGHSVIVLDQALETGSLKQRLGRFGAGEGVVLAPVDEDAPAIIIATGGTTGTPKGVYYDHRGLGLFMIAGSAYDGGNRFDTQLAMSPFFHLALMTGVFARLWAGGAVRTLRRFDAGNALMAIEEGCTRTAAAGTLLAIMRDHPRFAQTHRTGLKSIRLGGMPSGPEFLLELMASYPNAALRHSYAATEFGTVTAVEHEDFLAGRIDGIGRPHPGAEVLIVREDGSLADVGEVGELVVSCPWQSRGYWDNAEETAATYRSDGIHLGDLGSVDEDGWFSIAGRRKEMIISGGENVFPAEVEVVLRRHPGVVDLIVYGMQDERWGERIEIGVVVHEGSELSLEELREFGRKDLAGYKLPKSMRVIDEIPLTTVRKPDRRAARAAALADGGRS